MLDSLDTQAVPLLDIRGLTELTRERRMSSILITHDLGLAAAYCDAVVVMEKGRVVEAAPAARIVRAPQHPYTQRLLRATPRPGVSLHELIATTTTTTTAPSRPPPQPDPSVLLRVDALVKEYPAKSGGKPFRAVDGISFALARGESLGLVGESGCGKSTNSMMIVRLLDPTSGSIEFDGQSIGAIPARAAARHPIRKRIQMVFQDATDSLDPRYTAARAIAEPIRLLGARARDGGRRDALRARCEELTALVGLPTNLLDRFPHQLSGGRKARVGIARAIALNPDLVVLDEPTAALDVSVQAMVLNLLDELKARLGTSYLFVSHDLHVVRLLCDRVIVMRAGRIEEEGTAEVLEAPCADYTRTLIAAAPRPRF